MGTEAKVKNKRQIAPQFTAGVAEYWVNLGKNSEDKEIETILKGVRTDFLFNELARRHEKMADTLNSVLNVTGVEGQVEKCPDIIHELHRYFKDMESHIGAIKKAVRIRE